MTQAPLSRHRNASSFDASLCSLQAPIHSTLTYRQTSNGGSVSDIASRTFGKLSLKAPCSASVDAVKASGDWVSTKHMVQRQRNFKSFNAEIS